METILGCTLPKQVGKQKKWKTQDPGNEDRMQHNGKGREFPGGRKEIPRMVVKGSSNGTAAMEFN